MKTTIINAFKNWAFSSTCFASTMIGFSEIEGSMPVFLLVCSAVGVVIISVFMAFGAEAILEQFKKNKDKWNGIGRNQHLQH